MDKLPCPGHTKVYGTTRCREMAARRYERWLISMNVEARSGLEYLTLNNSSRLTLCSPVSPLSVAFLTSLVSLVRTRATTLPSSVNILPPRSIPQTAFKSSYCSRGPLRYWYLLQTRCSLWTEWHQTRLASSQSLVCFNSLATEAYQ